MTLAHALLLALAQAGADPAAAAAPAPAAAAAPVQADAPAKAPPGHGTGGKASAGLTGKVAERLDVPGYTYLRVENADGSTWAAVPTNAVAVGAEVTVASGIEMANFESKSLKRSFDRIVFGQVEGSAAGAGGPVAAAGSEAGDAPAGHAVRLLDSAELSGFARLGLGYTLPPRDEQLIGGRGGFRVADFRLGVELEPADDFEVVASVELSAPQVDPADPLAGQRVVALKDAYVEHEHGPMKLRAGQFRPGYYAEMLQSDATLPFLSRSMLATGVQPPEGFGTRASLAPDRQVGVMVGPNLEEGDTNYLAVSAGLFNGNGPNQLFNDNNLPSAYARLEWAMAKLKVGVNGGIDFATAGVRPNRLSTTNVSYGADVTFGGERLDVLAGFLGRNTTYSFAGLQSEAAYGAMGQARYKHESGFEGAVRGTWFEPSTAQADDTLIEGAVMVGYKPAKMPVRLFVQYTLRMEEAKVSYPNDSVDLVLHATW